MLNQSILIEDYFVQMILLNNNFFANIKITTREILSIYFLFILLTLNLFDLIGNHMSAISF